MRIRRLTILFILTMFSSVGLADIYKWIDGAGNVHYTQYKPTKYESVLVSGPPPPPSDSRDLNEKFASEIDKRAEERNKAKDNAVAASDGSDAQNCKTAQQNLKTLQENPRVRFKNAQGEDVIVSGDQRDARMESSRNNVKTYCK